MISAQAQGMMAGAAKLCAKGGARLGAFLLVATAALSGIALLAGGFVALLVWLMFWMVLVWLLPITLWNSVFLFGHDLGALSKEGQWMVLNVEWLLAPGLVFCAASALIGARWQKDLAAGKAPKGWLAPRGPHLSDAFNPGALALSVQSEWLGEVNKRLCSLPMGVLPVSWGGKGTIALGQGLKDLGAGILLIAFCAGGLMASAVIALLWLAPQAGVELWRLGGRLGASAQAKGGWMKEMRGAWGRGRRILLEEGKETFAKAEAKALAQEISSSHAKAQARPKRV